MTWRVAVLQSGFFGSRVGDRLAGMAFALYAAGTGETGLLAAILLAQLLPSLLLSLAGGMVVDRYRRHWWWPGSLLAQALCFGVLAVRVEPVLIVALIAVSSGCQSLAGPSGMVLLRQVAPEEHRARVAKQKTSLDGLAGVLGLAVAGVGYARLPVSWLMTANAVSFLVLAVCALAVLWGLERPAPVAPASPRPPGPWTGFGALAAPAVFGRGGLMLVFTVILGTSLDGVAGVFFLRHTLGLSPTVYALVIACWSAGLLLGSVVAAADRLRGSGLGTLGAAAWLMGACIALPTVLDPPGAVVAAAFGVGGVANGVFNAALSVRIFDRVAAGMQGRGWAAFSFLASLATVTGYLVGAMLDAAVARQAMFAAGCIPAVVGALAVVAASPRVGARRPGATRRAPTVAS